MDSRVQGFLKAHRISVLSLLQEDNTVHSATLHYCYQESPLSFFFMTEKESEKCKSLKDKAGRPAALVIGFSEEEFATFQAKGMVSMITDNLNPAWSLYVEKYPSRTKAQMSPDYVLLQFTPISWKYADIKTQPMTRVTSEGTTFP